MKKIINGRLYDTKTAECVGSYSNGFYCNDFHHFSEALYKKRTGEFFIYGEGGPMSNYAVRCGNNSWSGGEEIRPITMQEACKWAEKHLSAEEYEAVFGPVEE